jgi:outer membrane receptor for ferrienterochelin and colicins
MLKNRQRYLALLLGLAVTGLTASAQTGDVRDLTNFEIEDLARVHLFTASRHLDDPRKAPAAVTVIDHDEIVRYGWRTLAELLRSVTGIYTAYDRTYDYVGVRGFLESGDYNARVLLLIDGHRLNENIYDGAPIGTDFPLDLNLIDRVEIVRGPGSSLYGTNAELAVVNVFTRRPEKRVAVEIGSEYQSYAGRTAEVTASSNVHGAEVLASGSLYRSNGPTRLFFPEYASPDTNNGYADDLDGDRHEHVFAALRRNQFRVEGAFGTRDKLVPNAAYATNFNDRDNRTIDTRGFVDATWSHDFGADTQLDLRAYYDAYRYWASYPYGGTHSPDRSVQVNDAAADWVGLEAVLGHRLGRHRIVAGGTEEYSFRINQRNYYVGQAPFLDDNRRLTLSAVFGEAELNPSAKLSLNVGGRADWYSTFGNAVSPRLALMYLPLHSTSVKYVFNRAFRAPDPYAEFYVDNLNPNETSRKLQTERMQSHSVIFEQGITSWLRATAVGFRNNMKHVIAETSDPDTGAISVSNGLGDAGHGFELELVAKKSTSWGGRASYSILRSEKEETRRTAPNTPSTLGKLNLTSPATANGLLGIELNYNGPQPNYLGQRIPAAFLTNATLSTRFKRSGWSLAASCYNLLDRRWSTPTGPEVLPAATVQNGRTLQFRIVYRRALAR